MPAWLIVFLTLLGVAAAAAIYAVGVSNGVCTGLRIARNAIGVGMPPAPKSLAADRPPADWLNRRAEIEQELFDMATGKRPLPTEADCRRMALRLGTPTDHQAR